MIGFRAALDALIGKQKMPKNAVIIGAGGGARAAVYSLITAGFQRVVVFNRHLHRAEGLVRHFGRSASHMELRAMTWHESVIEAELSKTKVLINASAVTDPANESPVPAELLVPDLLVLDEPNEGLDLLGRKLVADIVQEQRRRGRSTLLVSHVLPEVEKLCDRVAVLVAGQLVYRGLVSALTRDPHTGAARSLEQGLQELYENPRP